MRCVCKWCGVEFWPEYKQQEYCDTECYLIAEWGVESDDPDDYGQ